MTAQQVCYCFNAQGPSQQVVTGSTDFAAAPFVDLMRIAPADVGSSGDDIVWIVHARIGDADLSGIAGSGRARLRFRVVDHTGTGQRECSMDVGTGLAWSPVKTTQQQGCVTYCTIHRATASTPVGVSACLRVQAAFGWYSGQTITQNIALRVEDVTVIAWNLTRLTARAIPWQFNAATIGTPRLTATPQNFAGTVSLSAPSSGMRTWLCYAGAYIDCGSNAVPAYCDLRVTTGVGTAVLFGPIGTVARQFNASIDASDYAYVAGVGVVEVAAGDPAASLQLRGWDSYNQVFAGEKHGRLLGRQVFAVDISTLGPAYSQHNDPAVGDGARTMYGAPAGHPNHGEQDTDRIDPATVLGQHRIAHGWAVPLNDHDPSLRVTFASELYLNGAASLPSSRQSPLYVMEMDLRDRHPDYQSAAFATGRGAAFVEHFGYYAAVDDPIDANGDPTRILRALGNVATRSFFGVAQCLVSFYAWAGTLDQVEEQDAIGPTTYIVPGRESLDPGSLPVLRYEPNEFSAAGAVHRGVQMTTLDGRVISWGRFLAPREVWSLTWRLKTSGSPSRDQVLGFLRDCPNGVFAWKHPMGGDLRAWACNGASLRHRNVVPGIWEIVLEIVELTWTGGS